MILKFVLDVMVGADPAAREWSGFSSFLKNKKFRHACIQTLLETERMRNSVLLSPALMRAGVGQTWTPDEELSRALQTRALLRDSAADQWLASFLLLDGAARDDQSYPQVFQVHSSVDVGGAMQLRRPEGAQIILWIKRPPSILEAQRLEAILSEMGLVVWAL